MVVELGEVAKARDGEDRSGRATVQDLQVLDLVNWGVSTRTFDSKLYPVDVRSHGLGTRDQRGESQRA